MQVVYERSAGLDIYKRTVMACANTPSVSGQPHKERRMFRTMTKEISQMRDWLKSLGITHVAMESTGVVPTDHRLAEQHSIPLSEVAHEAVVIEKVGGDLRDLIDTFYQQADFTPRIAYEIDEPMALLEFVKAHLCVTFVPAFAKKRIDEQTLISLRLTNPPCQRAFGMAWHQEHYLSQAACAFRKFVVVALDSF